MNEEKTLEDLKPFEQKPYWSNDAKFVFSGNEFERLFQTLQPFLGLAFLFQSKMDQAINEGTIQVKYEYTDGSGEVAEEDLKTYTQLLMDMLEKQKQEKELQEETNVKPLNSKSKIITEI